jgi:3-oxoacyl-[acyl-carrier protein] reductase
LSFALPRRRFQEQIVNEFEGRNVLVTGGAYGIGRAIVEALAARGAKIAFSYLTSADDARSLEAKTGAIGLRADLTQPEGASGLVEAAAARIGPIDTLVANAGGIIRRSPLVDCDLALWNDAFALNVTSTFLACKAVLPAMIAARRGVIITMSSLAGHNGGGVNAVHYGTAKGALLAFTKGLAREVGPFGVRVNGVAPGLIATRFHDIHSTQAGRADTVAQTPLRREGAAEDVAGAVAFLASEQAAFVTAEIVEVNGGLGLF